MQFKDVIGQSAVKDKLRGMVQTGKVPHALMLPGPEGSGGLSMALAFAQYIQCENRSAGDSCGVCPSCVKNSRFIHPDVHFTFPVITKKNGDPAPVSADYMTEWRSALAANPYMNANDWLQSIGAENKQGNITVRECHTIIHNISLKTYEAGYKVQIIWLAENLRDAGNTLLKIIEEPPAGTVFILVVENIEVVLTTVISRTQLVKMNAIDDGDVKDALVKRFEMEEGAARRIARLCDGNFNAALLMAGGDEGGNDKLLRPWLLACFNLKQKPSGDNTQNLVQWVDTFSKAGRENQKIFLKYALFFLRECFMVRLTGKSNKLEGDELKFAQGLSARLSPEQFETINKILNRLYYAIERNANPKVQFMSASFRIASAFKNEEVLMGMEE